MIELKSKVFMNSDQLKAALDKAVPQRLAQCALMVEAEAKKLLSRGGAGAPTTDLLGNKTKTFTPSEIGQPPHLRTGNLRASIKTEKAEKSYLVGPAMTAPYGRIHEFGGHINVTAKMRMWLGMNLGIWKAVGSTVNIPARPFMAPALANCLKKFAPLFKDVPLGGIGA